MAEHDLPCAREQLASGWKECLGMRAWEAASGAGAVRQTSLLTVVLAMQFEVSFQNLNSDKRFEFLRLLAI